MIIKNGTLSISGLNSHLYREDGAPYRQYSNFVEMPAQIVPLEQDAHRHTSATGSPIDYVKYMILVDALDYERARRRKKTSSTAYISLKNGASSYVQVQSVEYLRAVSQYKLIVIQRRHG